VKPIVTVLPVPDLPMNIVLPSTRLSVESSSSFVAWKLKYSGVPLIVFRIVIAGPQGFPLGLPDMKLCRGEKDRKFSDVIGAGRGR